MSAYPRMYILVREEIPRGLGIVAVAHAAVACVLKYQDHPDTQAWLDTSFRKVVCLVTDAEFEKAKELEDHVVMTELALDKAETAIAFRPRWEYPKRFNYLRLIK